MVRIGLVGAGFIAEIHANAFRPLAGRARITAVTSRSEEKARAFAGRHGIGAVVPDFEALLARHDVDVVDLCVPNHVHAEMAVAAARAGKHVICEKPLTGYFGEDAAGDRVGETVPKRRMWLNFVYAPPVAKIRRFMERSRGAILDLRAEESHSGSHAAYARRWRTSGGGSLLRLGERCCI
jgi:predicted dehydrogenase